MKPAQAVFNVCNMVNAVAIASVATGRVMHLAAPNKPFLLAAAALAFFLADTVPVAAIMNTHGRSWTTSKSDEYPLSPIRCT